MFNLDFVMYLFAAILVLGVSGVVGVYIAIKTMGLVDEALRRTEEDQRNRTR